MSATEGSQPKEVTRSPDLTTIRVLGRLLDDLERLRVMNGNRIGAVEREYGGQLPALTIVHEYLAAAEHEAVLELCRVWRKHPLAPWAREYRGLGEKSIARLVSIIGDPAARENPAKLWAYCGYGDPARIDIPRGATQEELLKRGNPHAKKQVWIIATSMLKAGNRETYDHAREHYREATHDKSCRRCGPAGKPAPAGSSLSDGHKHARAIRAVAKAFLLDLWIVSSHQATDAHTIPAGDEPG